MSDNVAPHGGQLTTRAVPEGNRAGLLKEAAGLATIQLGDRESCDVEMLGNGAFSPLTGFMGEKDFHGVCDNMQLSNGTAWPIPITCSTDSATAEKISIGERVALKNTAGEIVATLAVSEKYSHDRKKESLQIYRTDSPEHPGVSVVQAQGDVCLGGEVAVLSDNASAAGDFGDNRLSPTQTRAAFAERGWTTVVAFQTRNPIHRAHEYLTKCALEICDGLLIHPLVGETKKGDIPADVRMKCYRTLIDHYYSAKHTMLGVLPAAMRYAGPREAILHAILRQNYGCTHFIVGRDHAGVGSYYGTYDAQEIFNELPEGALKIVPLKFEHSAWSKKAGGMVSTKTFPKIEGDQIFLSGTKVREMLQNGEDLPQEFTRPEISKILMEWVRTES
jgi:sulfate adenylyltransferase